MYALIYKDDVVKTSNDLEDLKELKERFFCAFIYYAHYEKSGYNTFVVLDELYRKSDGTPL